MEETHQADSSSMRHLAPWALAATIYKMLDTFVTWHQRNMNRDRRPRDTPPSRINHLGTFPNCHQTNQKDHGQRTT